MLAVFRGGGVRIAAGDSQHARPADPPGRHELMDVLEARVEAPVEPDLQFDPGLVHRCQGVIDAGASSSARGFSQKMCLPAGPLFHDGGRACRAGRDQHGFDFRIGQQLMVIFHYARMPSSSARAWATSRRISHTATSFASGMAWQGCGVHAAHAACPNDSDLCFWGLVSSLFVGAQRPKSALWIVPLR